MLLKRGASLNHYFLALKTPLKISCSQINQKGKVLTDSQTISDSFNTYFSTIGLDLTTKFKGQDTNAYLKFLSTSNISSLFISPCTENEVIQQINSLKNNSSCGPDEIS